MTLNHRPALQRLREFSSDLDPGRAQALDMLGRLSVGERVFLVNEPTDSLAAFLELDDHTVSNLTGWNYEHTVVVQMTIHQVVCARSRVEASIASIPIDESILAAVDIAVKLHEVLPGNVREQVVL